MTHAKHLVRIAAAAAVLAALCLIGVGARATGTPENVAVVYMGSNPNGQFDIGNDSNIDADSASFDFQFGAVLPVTATNTSTLTPYSISGDVVSPFDILIDASSLAAGVYSLSFDNTNGGLTDGTSDTYWTLTPYLTLVNPISSPTLTGLTPTQATAGNPGLTLTATGTGFVSGATVDWNGNSLTTTFGSATSVSALVPASDLTTAGTASVTVMNPDTGTTSPMTFTIVAAPTLTSIAPNTATAGSAAITLTATGTHFLTGDLVQWNGTPLTTTPVSATTLTASVPPTDLATAGSASVTVSTPDDVASNTVSFTVAHPPTVASVLPNSASAGSAALTASVNGAYFVAGDTILWNGANLTTTFVGATKLTASVPATELSNPGTATVSVRTSDNISSNSVQFTIVSSPTVTAVSPSTAKAGSGPVAVTVTGTGFANGAVLRWSGSDLTTVFVSSTKLTATIPAGDLAAVGAFPISAMNHDGGTTGSVSFTVTQPTPGIASISPGTAGAGSPATQFTITGSNFDNHAKVSFAGGAAITPDSVVSSTELLVTLPAADLSRAGSYAVTVGTDGGASSAADLNVAPVASFGAAGLKMISSPYDTSGLSITPTSIGWIDSVTGAETDDTSLSIVDWTGTAYAAPTDGLKLGVGYWVRVPSLNDAVGKPESLSLLVKGTAVAPDSEYKIALKSGWNLIGDALPQSVPLVNLVVQVSVSGQLISEPYLKAAQSAVVGFDFYSYDSSVSSTYADQSITQANTALKPYVGYWVLALTPCTLEFPAGS